MYAKLNAFTLQPENLVSRKKMYVMQNDTLQNVVSRCQVQHCYGRHVVLGQVDATSHDQMHKSCLFACEVAILAG
jgi:hypothetical protein